MLKSNYDGFDRRVKNIYLQKHLIYSLCNYIDPSFLTNPFPLYILSVKKIIIDIFPSKLVQDLMLTTLYDISSVYMSKSYKEFPSVIIGCGGEGYDKEK